MTYLELLHRMQLAYLLNKNTNRFLCNILKEITEYYSLSTNERLCCDFYLLQLRQDIIEYLPQYASVNSSCSLEAATGRILIMNAYFDSSCSGTYYDEHDLPDEVFIKHSWKSDVDMYYLRINILSFAIKKEQQRVASKV